MKTCPTLLFLWEWVDVVLIKPWKWGASKTQTSLLVVPFRLGYNMDK